MVWEDAVMDIFLPVIESATVLAAHYANACGRDVVLAEDMRLGIMYAARNVAGKQVGSLFPEVYESDEDEEDEDEDEEDEDPPWTRYEGPEEIPIKMNECLETWSMWEPETPAERALKNAIDNQANALSGVHN